ncbi:Transposon I factor [Penicillium canescens]|uniref:Transposon I factor n=1 Tax=Penicillium canescens TaxID=5083 RepID=UPI0026DF0884|nr:Transposon I factor [Penicillium canescens]KAJ6078154.1 Transposon I factor [Penicillium canescens]
METDLTPRDTGQDPGIGGGRKDLTRRGDPRPASDQPLRGRKQRSAEQALLLLQEQIYTAWRGRRVLCLVSFDVKGAYNGRMKARGIPETLLRWTEAFCSERTATIQINGQESEIQILPQAGLPQGSPLSPILFLFFNADLVQRQIDSQGGAIAFVDDFTAWVTGPTARSNREGIEAIITHALKWESRSGATFEAEKTAIIHFAPKTYKLEQEPFIIKGQSVEPKEKVKILGVLMDTRLKYKEHIARAASKGLEAAMELRRLRGLSPATARQLFSSTVAPVVDYASNVWMHAFKNQNMGPINRVQRVGAQAIVGTFLTVATGVAEAEAGREDVDRHTHATGNQSSSQKYRPDQEVQEIPPLTTIPSSGRDEKHRDGIAGNHQSVYAGTMGSTHAN